MVYLPPVFSEARPEVLAAHIERYDFGTLISHGEGGLQASRVPFLAERTPDGLLLNGHLARANPQVAHLAAGGEVLAVFAGPHAYVSPTWYQAGPSVPTWNYADVHAYGTVRLIAEEAPLRALLQRLSERHERGNPAPWRMEDQPEDYLAGMIRGIVGFAIAVTRLEGKYKLSQNRPAADRPRIIAALAGRGDEEARAV
ncbi:MAG TPA: FMN-binding negative transcriptional regulator, partial [Stellaceae bacterium]|nr:FMN-binding negative transcriptional regulator [Stellaceae bacterium]